MGLALVAVLFIAHRGARAQAPVRAWRDENPITPWRERGAPTPTPPPAAPVATSLTLFAGTPSGLWRSADWGGTWSRVLGTSRGESLRDVGAVHSILPTGPRVYLGADTGLFASDDFGETWSRRSLAVPVYAVLPSRYPQSDPTVFAATAEGLQKSGDGGLTFMLTSLRGTRVTRLDWPGPALIAATSSGVVISMDGGGTFGMPGAGLPPGEVLAMVASSYFGVDPVIFAAVGDTGVHRSSDGGRTWASSGLPGHRVSDLAWIGPLLYAATDRGLLRSENAGQRWSPLGEGLRGPTPIRLLFPLAPDSAAEVFLATSEGVFRSADGGVRWTTTGLRDVPVIALATFPPLREVPKGRRR